MTSPTPGSAVKEISIGEFTRTVLLRGVKRVWYDEDYRPFVDDSYALWELGGQKHQFQAKRDYIYEAIGENHRKDIDAYRERLVSGEKELPPIIVHLLEDGRRVVWDGNRRCMALMFTLMADEGAVLPAYVLDHREHPY